jgi:hypothetical protein
MAIPLQSLKHKAGGRVSLDSEASAILSYALGTHVDSDERSSTDSRCPSSSNDEDAADDERFLKENDPLEAELGIFPQRKVLS